ncbi:3616_t:CDS:2 [Funneliformis geosporum]|uniref:10023_t:CDS:1 n=1 Tax=Funneliformis geosporum TaxID=1117311 RepID=A0A9W4SC72_9GLOM|nr:3616_t:CDS:2 [Funneliformis geosporum]CAI2163049.1 10023_t:CDS:2 [Funneliformis geosporum]
MCSALKNKLPTLCQTLFEAKAAKRLTFADIGKKIDKDEVWVAAVFYGQAKPEESDLKKLSVVLDVKENYLVYGYPLKAIINEKFGDGIMSAIDFTAKVEKIEKDDHERVKITFDGKFLPFKKW